MRRFLLAALTLAAVLRAQPTAAQDWTRVQTLPQGARLRIHVGTAAVDGRLREVTDRGIVIDRRTFSRGEIEQIDWVRAQKAKGARRGLLIGLVVGAAYGTAVGQGSGRPNAAIWFGSTAGVLGALFGMGASEPKVETVYGGRGGAGPGGLGAARTCKTSCSSCLRGSSVFLVVAEPLPRRRAGLRSPWRRRARRTRRRLRSGSRETFVSSW